MDAQHITYQNEVDGFRTKYDLCIPVQTQDNSVADDSTEYEQRVVRFLQEYSETEEEIENLTNYADGIDYAISVSAGIITGIIDAAFVGEWDFNNAKALSNETINRKVIDFAKKSGLDEWAAKNNRDSNRLDAAIQFLEKKFPLPGDGGYKDFKGAGVNDMTHHLDDFCHHPTLIGLISCVIVQFSGNSTYHPSIGAAINVPIEVNAYGNFVSSNTWGKVFSGIVNWFFNVAETIKNRKGHLFSDMAGSSTAAKKGNAGMGLPGTFLSTAKELSSLPCFRETGFAETLRKAFQNGIGPEKKQVDLGVLNSLFEGASSKLDMRTELAVGHELKRQAFPVMLNEMIVRGLYFVRRFVQQMKEKRSVSDLDWKTLFPARNRTIIRMLTISTGTFAAIDLADAAIHSAGNGAAFVLRVNFVGVGRFSLAVGSDLIMGIKKGRLEVAMASAEVAMTSAKMLSTMDAVEGKQTETQKRLDAVSAEIDEVYKLKF